MGRPKKPLRDKVIQFLQSNKGIFTYGEIAKRLGSHPLGVGMCLKAMGKDPVNKDLCMRVGPKDKSRRGKIHFSYEQRSVVGTDTEEEISS